ncbi:MAG: type VI secretion system tip protein TssI/VgrG [Polyangiaceae bacterium]
MATVELDYEGAQAADSDALRVVHFDVREAISRLFRVEVRCLSHSDAIDIAGLVGRRASLRMGRFRTASPTMRTRVFSGVVAYAELSHAVPTGESTYRVRIEPELGLLAHRGGCRVFQACTLPEIVRKVLADAGVEATWRIDEPSYRKLEYRVQYNETDLAFVERLLVEAGISYFFSDENGHSDLVMADAPHLGAHRAALPFIDNASLTPHHEYLTDVHVAHAVASTAHRVRDYDARNPGYRPTGTALADGTTRRAPPGLDQYRHAPGYSVVETPARTPHNPIGDDRGVFRSDEAFANARARLALQAVHAARREVRFVTNTADLSPGTVFGVSNHPHPELPERAKLLALEATLRGVPQTDEWSFSGRAALADAPYRPSAETDKPRVLGPQTAIVVGPKGEEIHVDELGRVRVQFHWDRSGEFGVLDDQSSCWLRVSQGWAGASYGMMAIPRVGHEVLVAFLDGDPDQPLVVGRLYNETEKLPYALPRDKTVSTWKSLSSPRSDGFNEIKFDDARGRELVYVQAERDMTKLVKHDESISVGVNRSANVGSVDTISVGTKHHVVVRQAHPPAPTIPPTELTMVDKKITFTTGEATIELDGPDIKLMAKGHILLSAGGGISTLAVGSGALPDAAPRPERGSVDFTSRHTTNITSRGALTLASTDELNAVAKGVHIGSTTSMGLKARELALHGTQEATLDAAFVQINGPGLPSGRVVDAAPETILRGSSTVFVGGPTTLRDITRDPNGVLCYGTGVRIGAIRDPDGTWRRAGGAYEVAALRTIMRLDSTPHMHAAYDDLERSHHTITYIPYSSADGVFTRPSSLWGPYNAYTHPENAAGARQPGVGSDSTIGWNPDVHGFGPPGTTEASGQPGADIIAAHESIHAVHNATGSQPNGPMTADRFPLNVGEERNTVGLPASTYNRPTLPGQTSSTGGPVPDPLHGTQLPDTTHLPYTENQVRQDYASRGWTSPTTGQPPVQRPSYSTPGPGDVPGGPF